MVAKWKDLDDYLKVADIFVEYTLLYLKRAELDLLLRDIHTHISGMDKARRETHEYIIDDDNVRGLPVCNARAIVVVSK